jgi:putrescine transport system substrate-binding protein
MDEKVMNLLASSDPGNAHVVPYMWGTTAIGFNVAMVKKALGDEAKLDSWSLIFDPEIAGKLASCGISMLDDELEGINAALIYLGKDANTEDPKDIEAAAEVLKNARASIKYFHSSQYINDLANGDICVAHGYSGDILQARDRANEAKSGAEIQYIIPVEGAIVWVDVMAIPRDAPHPKEAHAFINYLMQPEVIAEISNYVAYANANKDATPLLDEAIRNDPGIYPSEKVRAGLTVPKPISQKIQRLRTRSWTRIKTGL